MSEVRARPNGKEAARAQGGPRPLGTPRVHSRCQVVQDTTTCVSQNRSVARSPEKDPWPQHAGSSRSLTRRLCVEAEAASTS